MSLQPGTTLGRYQILEPLGAGGMATVYKAFQPALERIVALKVLRAGFAEDPEFVDRFRREAKAIAHLRHPNIVQVFDLDDAEGRYFMAMEFLEGGTLKERLAPGRGIDPGEIVAVLAQVGAALTHAHGLGIVHRDVKPSNVMLTTDGRAVVTDFGIAKILAGTQHTQTGVGIGTPEYMSPEQGEGGPIDHRADIYSMGVMAYEMFTGRVPFSADTPVAIVLAHIRDPLPLPSTVAPGVGQRVERVLLKALAKEPAQRFETASAFGEAVREAVLADGQGTLPTIVSGASRPAMPSSRTRGSLSSFFDRAWAVPAIALLALALVSGGMYAALVGSKAGDDAAARTTGATTALPSATPTAPAIVTSAVTPAITAQAAPSTQPTSSGGTRIDPELATSARLYPAADQPGPELRSISSGGPFGLLVITKAPIQYQRIVSVGPITVEHPKQSFSTQSTLDTSCCYTAPALPGLYRIQVYGNGKLVAEIPYEVR